MMAERRSYEPEATPIKPLVIFAVGLALLIALAIVVAYFTLQLFIGQQATQEARRPAPVLAPAGPPGPRLQTNAPQDLRAYQQAEEELLSSYGWVDQQSGRVHIPIQRAMQLLVERGLPKAGGAPEETPR
jgi:hypothetical protein